MGTLSDGLLATSERLVRSQRPTQTDLKRAISTAYYALFHTVAELCADGIAGQANARRNPDWLLVYRSLEHSAVKRACEAAVRAGRNAHLVEAATVFVDLQFERQEADYNPHRRYRRSEASGAVAPCRNGMAAFAALHPSDRRSFAVNCVLRRR